MLVHALFVGRQCSVADMHVRFLDDCGCGEWWDASDETIPKTLRAHRRIDGK